MKIEIFGMGCPNCIKLEENVKTAVADAGMEAEIVKVNTLEEIVARGVMSTPALAVDGVVKSAGKVLSPNEIAAILKGVSAHG